MPTPTQYVSIAPVRTSISEWGPPAGSGNGGVACRALGIQWSDNNVTSDTAIPLVLFQLPPGGYDYEGTSTFPFAYLDTVSGNTLNWTWPSVNVTQGAYLIMVVNGFGNWTVMDLNVVNSTDTSCLSNPLLFSPPTAAFGPQGANPTTAAPTPTTTPLPANTSTISTSTPTHHVDVGAIAGGVVGGGVFIAAILWLMLLYIRRRSRVEREALRGPGFPRRPDSDPSFLPSLSGHQVEQTSSGRPSTGERVSPHPLPTYPPGNRA